MARRSLNKVLASQPFGKRQSDCGIADIPCRKSKSYVIWINHKKDTSENNFNEHYFKMRLTNKFCVFGAGKIT